MAIFSAATTPSVSPSRLSVSASAASSGPTSELCDQRLRLRLGVAAGNGEREKVLDEFMIEQSLRPAFEEALAKTGSMS